MGTPTASLVREISDHRAELCLSLYVPQGEPNDLWVRRTVAHVAGELERRGRPAAKLESELVSVLGRPEGSPPETEAARQPVSRAQPGGGPELGSRGTAAFWSPDFMRIVPLPSPVTQRAVVGDRFFVQPLLDAVGDSTQFHILALTPHTARLFQASRYTIRPRMPVPLSTADEMVTPAEVLSFYREVDRSVHLALGDASSPLVLACVGYLAALYRSANTYPRLIGPKVPGSPDRWSLDELRDNAWRLVACHVHDSSEHLVAVPAGGAPKSSGGHPTSSNWAAAISRGQAAGPPSHALGIALPMSDHPRMGVPYP